jgi:hypothetical protein
MSTLCKPLTLLKYIMTEAFNTCTISLPIAFIRHIEHYMCLVSCDHVPRRSMSLFRAKAVVDELIAGLPPRSPHQLQQIA